jgi:hypothetical protein
MHAAEDGAVLLDTMPDDAAEGRGRMARAEAAEQRVKELENKLEEALARRSWWRRSARERGLLYRASTLSFSSKRPSFYKVEVTFSYDPCLEAAPVGVGAVSLFLAQLHLARLIGVLLPAKRTRTLPAMVRGERLIFNCVSNGKLSTAARTIHEPPFFTL